MIAKKRGLIAVARPKPIVEQAFDLNGEGWRC